MDNKNFKRSTQNRVIDYLEINEMKAILEAIDPNTKDGYRDYTLFTFLYNTGARVGEVIKLPVKALKLRKPFEVKITGRGDKERLCPLWAKTAKLLRSLIKRRKLNPKADTPIFVNHRGQPLKPCNIQYLLNKYVSIASKKCPSLTQKHIHLHIIRCSAAIALMQEHNVGIKTIATWLGHKNPEL